MPAIAVIAAGTAVWLAYNWFETPVDATRDEEAIVEAKISEIVQLNEKLDFAMPPIGSFDAILIRPIFSPNRRAVAGSPKTVVTSQKLAVQLVGIVGDESDQRILLVPGSGGDAVTVRKGEDYGGWTFEMVDESGGAVLRNEAGDVEILKLNYEVAPTPTAQSRREQRRRKAQQAQQTQQKSLRQQATPTADEDDEDDEADENEEEQ